MLIHFHILRTEREPDPINNRTMGTWKLTCVMWTGAMCLMLQLIPHPATGGRSSGRGDDSLVSKVNVGDEKQANWPGHMEPLGAKATKRSVPVREGFPSPQTFFLDYVLASLPVVFRGGAKLSPAFKIWSDQQLRLRPEAETTLVDVEVRKKEDRTQPTMRMKFSEFLERYQKYDEYLVDGIPTFLREDVLLPPSLVCDDIINRIIDVVMWFSSGGTKSVIHNDDTDNINCLFSGQKEILFINYTQYRHQVELDHVEGSYSSIDVEKVDMEKYPGLRDVEFYQARMYPGDCIYIPFKWIHQVNSFGRNIAVNVWWDHSCERIPNPEICGATDRQLTIADILLQAEKPVPFEEDFGENEPSPYDELIEMLTKDEEASFTEEDFKFIVKNRMPILNDLIWNEECDSIAHDAFKMLDNSDDDVISRNDWEGIRNDDETFHFQIEAKLLMLTDIGHEQDAQRRLRDYEAERKKKPPNEEDPSVLLHYVEPLNLDELQLIHKGEDQGVKREASDIVTEGQTTAQQGVANDANPEIKVEL